MDKTLQEKSAQAEEYIFSAWHDQYQLIHHLVLYSNVLMALTGPQGQGKTSFIKGLLCVFPSEIVCKATSSEALNSLESLSSELNNAFGSANKTDELLPLEHVLAQQFQESKKHCLLIIDNAHHLPEDVLLALLKLIESQGEEAYFHCLMVGDTTLPAKFDALFPDKVEALVHKLALPPLSIEGAKGYLRHRLTSLGGNPVSRLSDEEISNLIKASQDNLAKLEKLALDRLKKESAQASSFSMDNYQRLFKWGGGIAVFGLVFSLYQTVTTKTVVPMKAQELVLPRTPQSMPISSSRSQFNSRPELVSTIDLEEKKKTHTARYTPISIIPNYTLLAEKKEKPIDATRVAEKITSQLAHKNSITTTQSSPIKQHDVVSSSLVQVKTQEAQREQQLKLASTTPTKSVTKTSKYSRPSAHRENQKGNNAKPKRLASTVAIKSYHYGIQLLGAYDLTSIKQFIREYRLGAKAKCYKTTLHGKAWYVLFYGEYATYQQAKQSLERLSGTLKTQKPWVRSTKGLRAVVS